MDCSRNSDPAQSDSTGPRVVAVAGPVGAGKTCLVNGIANSLPDATAVYFDHYQQLTDLPLSQMVRWLETGPDVDRLVVPEIGQHLAALRRGESIVDPITRQQLIPGEIIVLEMPLGRAHAPTACHIDYVIWIDVPLDVALARKVSSHVDPCLSKGPEERDACLRWLDRYFYSYLHGMRQLLVWQESAVRPGADLIVDGRADRDTVIREAMKGIRSRF